MGAWVLVLLLLLMGACFCRSRVKQAADLSQGAPRGRLAGAARAGRQRRAAAGPAARLAGAHAAWRHRRAKRVTAALGSRVGSSHIRLAAGAVPAQLCRQRQLLLPAGAHRGWAGLHPCLRAGVAAVVRPASGAQAAAAAVAVGASRGCGSLQVPLQLSLVHGACSKWVEQAGSAEQGVHGHTRQALAAAAAHDPSHTCTNTEQDSPETSIA